MTALRKKLQMLMTGIFFAAVIGIAFVAGQNYQGVSLISETNGTNPMSDTPQIAPTKITSEPTTSSSQLIRDTLLVVSQQSGISKIERLDPLTRARRVIFTDKDEALKLKQIGNVTADGGTIVVIMGREEDTFGGSLWKIATDGSGEKTELIGEFASPWPPAISPDGKKITYVSFSNAEKDGGFVLVVTDANGANKRELTRESTSITQPIFLGDGKTIAFIRGGSIMTISTGGGKPKELAEYPGRVPYDLACLASGQCAFIDGTGDKADVYLTQVGETQPEHLGFDGRESRPVFSPDGTSLAFISITETKGSMIKVYNSTTKATQTLGQGSLVVAWVRGGS